MPTCEHQEQISAQSTAKHHIENCRCNLRSLKNLTALLTLDEVH
jgi:hypothetical protein